MSGVPIGFRVATSQSATVPSAPAVASTRPCGANASEVTRAVCAFDRPGPRPSNHRSRRSGPFRRQSRSRRGRPSSKNATDRVATPGSTYFTRLPLSRLQDLPLPNPVSAAIQRPSGLKASIAEGLLAPEASQTRAGERPTQRTRGRRVQGFGGREEPPVGRERNRLRIGAEPFQLTGAAQRSRVPERDVAVPTRDRQQPPVRAERQHTRRALHRLDGLTRPERPRVDQVDGFAVSCHGQRAPVGTDRQPPRDVHDVPRRPNAGVERGADRETPIEPPVPGKVPHDRATMVAEVTSVRPSAVYVQPPDFPAVAARSARRSCPQQRPRRSRRRRSRTSRACLRRDVKVALSTDSLCRPAERPDLPGPQVE